MIRWSIWTTCWLIVYGKCGQIDRIFICLGRQSLISYRLAPFEFKVLGFFSQRLKGTHKKGCSNHFFCENQSGMGFGLVCIVASCFKQYTLKTQLGHQKSPELKLFQIFFFGGSRHIFFLDYIPSFWIIATHQSHQSYNQLPKRFPFPGGLTCGCVYISLSFVSICFLCLRPGNGNFLYFTSNDLSIVGTHSLLVARTASCKSDFFSGWFVWLICQV